MSDLSLIRSRILKGRGLTKQIPSKRHHTRLSSSITIRIPDNKKSHLMKLLEATHHDHIENILTYGSLKQIEKKYGIDYTTASKWRKILAVEALNQLSSSTIKSVVGGLVHEASQHEGVPFLEPSEGQGDNI
jgi:hypothetical protein